MTSFLSRAVPFVYGTFLNKTYNAPAREIGITIMINIPTFKLFITALNIINIAVAIVVPTAMATLIIDIIEERYIVGDFSLHNTLNVSTPLRYPPIKQPRKMPTKAKCQVQTTPIKKKTIPKNAVTESKIVATLRPKASLIIPLRIIINAHANGYNAIELSASIYVNAPSETGFNTSE